MKDHVAINGTNFESALVARVKLENFENVENLERIKIF